MMANSNAPVLECLCLADLLKKPIHIPEYQRYYTWKSNHVSDLLKDIFDRKTPYLMGTVILHEKARKKGKEVMDIVDGQQRLVTLTILLWELGEVKNSNLLEANFSERSALVQLNGMS